MNIRLNRSGSVYNLEVTDRIPYGYRVWNIGREGLEGYLPVCQVKPGTLSVVRETLRAVPMPEEDAALLKRVSMRYGVCDLYKAEKYVGGTRESRRIVRAALDLYRKYSEPG